MPSQTPESARSIYPVGPLVVVGSIGLFAFVDSLVLELTAVQRVLYSVTLGACAWLVAAGWKSIRLTGASALAIAAWIACVALWLLPVVGAVPFYPEYVVGDMASMLLPAILLIAGVVAPAVFCSTRSLVVLGIVLFAASAAAAALGIASGAARFEAPHDLLIVSLWLLAYRSRGLARLGTAVLLLAVLAFAFRSGYRTPVLLWIFCGAYCAALTWSFTRMILVAGPLVVLTVVLAGSAIRDAAIESLANTRFNENVQGEADASLLARFYEARDAVNQFEKRGGPINDVLGFGHGSTFRPVFGPIHNMTPQGVVHHIHFGPVLILYRYGLLGLAVYAWLLIRALASFLAQYKCSRKSILMAYPEMFFTLGIGISLIDGIMRNVMADPAFSYVVAGFLYHHLSQSDPMPSQRREWAVA